MSALEGLLESVGQPSLLELGKIKIGGKGAERRSKAGGTWRMPVSHDYFTITTTSRNASGDLVEDEALMRELLQHHADPDGMLRQIPIQLLSDEIDDVLQARFVWYGRTVPGAVSDGKTVTWYYDPVDMKPYNPPKVEPWDKELLKLTLKGTDTPLFKLHSVFSCTIASSQAKWGGVYRYRSASVISFKQLYSTLLSISKLTGGVLMSMPLWMVVRPMLVSPGGKTKNVNVVHCELRGSDVQTIRNIAFREAEHRKEFSENLGRIRQQYKALLCAPGSEPAEEVPEIVSEFAPQVLEEDSEPVVSDEPFAARYSAIRAKWWGKNKDELTNSGENVKEVFTAWVRTITGRDFDIYSIDQWQQGDLAACETALEMPDDKGVIDVEAGDVANAKLPEE